MDLHIHEDLEQISQSLADWLISDITSTLRSKDHYSFVLSGGNTPKRLYQLLASSPRKEQIDWEKIWFFIGDERYVPYADNRHNGKMCHEMLLDHVPVSKAHIHLMDTSLSPEGSAASYEELLKSLFEEKSQTFDFVLLGMGDDGHTLSLFPGTTVVKEQEKWVASPYVKAQKMYRITLTQPVVSLSGNIVFLAAGEKKAPVLKEVLEGTYNPDKYPSQLISRTNDHVHWFVDTAAASLLKK